MAGSLVSFLIIELGVSIISCRAAARLGNHKALTDPDQDDSTHFTRAAVAITAVAQMSSTGREASFPL